MTNLLLPVEGLVVSSAPALVAPARPSPLGSLVAGKIVGGDSLVLLAGVAEGTIDTFFVDWPYATSSPVRGKDDGAASRVYGPISFLTRALQAMYRAASLGAHLYIFGNTQGIPDTGLAMSLAGWYPTTIIAWDGCYVGTGGVWRGSWTPIFFASKGPAEVRVEGAFKNSFAIPALRRGRKHAYEKPPEVWERLSAPSVVKSTRVLDAFAGSGSSRATVEQKGAVWYGADIDPAFAEVEIPLDGWEDGAEPS